jgi:hypothetical protein
MWTGIRASFVMQMALDPAEFRALDRSPDLTFRATGLRMGCCDRIVKEFVPHKAGLPPRGDGSR